jgi:hypothetical protein
MFFSFSQELISLAFPIQSDKKEPSKICNTQISFQILSLSASRISTAATAGPNVPQETK